MNTLEALGWLPSYMIPFFTLSYPIPTPAVTDSFPHSSYYDTGLLDGCLIVTCIAVMAVLRDVSRIYILEPFAEWKLTRDLKGKHARQYLKLLAKGNEKLNGIANGVANGNGNGHSVESPPSSPTSPRGISVREAAKIRRSILRFAEQGWSFFYYTAQWAFGLYIHRNLPTKVLNPIDAWIDYPHIPIAGPLKFYYLTQIAFYLHQMLVLTAEARRSDHWQMMTHHVITVALMTESYFTNFTRIGCLIMMLMDCCDIFLPLAKMFRYLSFTTLCDATFAFFMLSWLVTRHFLFVFSIISTYRDCPRLIPPVWDTERRIFLSPPAHVGFVAMLVALQILQLIWFWMICRVAYRVASGKGAEDSRSDDEDDDEPSETESKKGR